MQRLIRSRTRDTHGPRGSAQRLRQETSREWADLSTQAGFFLFAHMDGTHWRRTSGRWSGKILEGEQAGYQDVNLRQQFNPVLKEL